MSGGTFVFIFLPLLISGFLFNAVFYPTRFLAGRADGQRLFFLCAASGMLLGTLSFSLIELLRMLGALDLALIQCTRDFLSRSIPLPHIGKTLFTVISAPLVGHVLNRQLCLRYARRKTAAKKSDSIDVARVVFDSMLDRFGTPLGQLLRKAAEHQKLVMVTLKSRKVYCGRVFSSPNATHSETEFVEILPVWSATRHKDSLNFGERVHYPATQLWTLIRSIESAKKVADAIDKELSSLEGSIDFERILQLKEASEAAREEIREREDACNALGSVDGFNIDDWRKLIPIGEVETVSHFDPVKYEEWFRREPITSGDSILIGRAGMPPPCIHADWDPEARRWVATSNDVPGLATEAETVEQLLAKLEVLVPELLEANGITDAPAQFELLARRFDPIRPAA